VTTRSDKFCRQAVLTDATRWYREDYPHVHVVREEILRRLSRDERERLTTLHQVAAVEFDENLMAVYETLYASYGGSPRDLPWAVT
jgi:hypothetical protein